MITKRYFGFRILQRQDNNTPLMFVFSARVKEVREWTGIKRSAEHEQGTQRIFRRSRALAIAKFLNSSSINTIPNNILLAFNQGSTHFQPITKLLLECIKDDGIDNGVKDQVEWGWLSFSYEAGLPDHLRPALIVDGQHRMMGMNEYKNENVPALFVCLLDASLQEQAFQFIVINSKAVKVSHDNAKSIIEDVDVAELRDRALKAGVKYAESSPILSEVNDSANSPFRQLLDWDYNRAGMKLVSLTAVEQSINTLRSEFNMLREDDDSLLELFFAIWRAVKNTYTEVWGKENTFMSKVNINALHEFLSDRLKRAWEFGMVDIFDPKSVEDRTVDMLKRMPEKFWLSDWTIERIQDSPTIKNLIKGDLKQMVENYNTNNNWYDNLRLPKMTESLL